MSPPASPPLAKTQTALIVGSTAGLGRALAEHFATQGWDLVITGRDDRDLYALASDLRLRAGVGVWPLTLDLNQPGCSWSLSATLGQRTAIQAVLLPAGAVDPADEMAADETLAAGLVRGNFLGLAEVVRQALPHLDTNGATIVGFGSIAACRGRSRNVYYGAAKRALAAYFEALRHSLAPRLVRVQYYVLGYIDTQLAAGQPLRLPKGDPHELAKLVRRSLHRDLGTRYFPYWWSPLCFALRILPWPLFQRLKF